MESLESIKGRISIHDLWDRYGYQGNSRLNPTHSPFRDDRNPSFSVFDDGKAFKDHATGQSGDQVNFIALAEGISIKDAMARFRLIAGVRHDRSSRKMGHVSDKEEKRNTWNQSLEIPSREQVAKIATLRGLESGAVHLAVNRGLLFTCSLNGTDAWVVSDSTRLNAQARRYDGKAWSDINGKAKSLWGSEGSWPIGLAEAKNFPSIALVEGGPDLLAAFHCLYVLGGHEQIAPIAILGGMQNLPKESRAFFEGKRVRIFPHDDDAGKSGAFRWGKQLLDWKLSVDLFDFRGLHQINGMRVKDLNDLCGLDLHSYRSNKRDIQSAMLF